MLDFHFCLNNNIFTYVTGHLSPYADLKWNIQKVGATWIRTWATTSLWRSRRQKQTQTDDPPESKKAPTDKKSGRTSYPFWGNFVHNVSSGISAGAELSQSSLDRCCEQIKLDLAEGNYCQKKLKTKTKRGSKQTAQNQMFN